MLAGELLKRSAQMHIGPIRSNENSRTIFFSFESITMNQAPTAHSYQSDRDQSEQVHVSLGDMAPLLLHAANANKAWLRDFADDVVQIPRDLYEVLVAYRDLLGRSAA